MKLGIVISSNDPETVWNAFRLGVFSSGKSDAVKIFLLAKGVECESLVTDKFPIVDEMSSFIESGGEILACGTCLEHRQSAGTEMCPISTMEDLYNLVCESDRVVTF